MSDDEVIGPFKTKPACAGHDCEDEPAYVVLYAPPDLLKALDEKATTVSSKDTTALFFGCSLEHLADAMRATRHLPGERIITEIEVFSSSQKGDA